MSITDLLILSVITLVLTVVWTFLTIARQERNKIVLLRFRRIFRNPNIILFLRQIIRLLFADYFFKLTVLNFLYFKYVETFSVKTCIYKCKYNFFFTRHKSNAVMPDFWTESSTKSSCTAHKISFPFLIK